MNLDLFRPINKQTARLKLGLAPDEAIVLYVGRFAQLKGIDRLVAAIPVWAVIPGPGWSLSVETVMGVPRSIICETSARNWAFRIESLLPGELTKGTCPRITAPPMCWFCRPSTRVSGSSLWKLSPAALRSLRLLWAHCLTSFRKGSTGTCWLTAARSP